MRIGALQKTTLIDFPGKISAIVFTQGCNFLCPYCYNHSLVTYEQKEIATSEILDFLAKRRRLIDGVVITGGEPTLQDDLPDFCSILKSLGYAVKLDTNGSRPDVLQNMLESNLLDYVAMDVKASPRGYPKEISMGEPGGAIIRSMELLNNSYVPHEFRIPCVAPFVDAQAFQDILDITRRDTLLFLQSIRLEHVLDPSFFKENGRALKHEEIKALQQQADKSGRICIIR